MVRLPSRSSPRACPLVYKLYILRCSSLVRISNKTLPFLPLCSPLNPNGPTRARDARPRPRAKPHLSISYRSRDRHHPPLNTNATRLASTPNLSRALPAMRHVLASQSRVSVCVRFRSGEPVLTVTKWAMMCTLIV